MTETRDKYIQAAFQCFAEHGFYGTSVARIAEQLPYSKQALLHHFGTKEKLYGEVLANISDRLSEQLSVNDEGDLSDIDLLESLFLNFLQHCVSHRNETQILIRELMDNTQRAEGAQNWYLKPFLEQLTSLVMNCAPDQFTSREKAFAFVYQLLGSISYFAISETTLTQMYDEEMYERFAQDYPAEIKKMIRARIEGS